MNECALEKSSSSASESKKRVAEENSLDNEQANTKKQKPGKKKKKKSKKDQPERVQVRRALQACCATNDFYKAKEIYEDSMKDYDHAQDDKTKNHLLLEPQSFYHMLNLCNGVAINEGRSWHVGLSTFKDNKKIQEEDVAAETILQPSFDERLQLIQKVQATMNKHQIPLSETAAYALISCYSRSSLTLDQAEAVLKDVETKNLKRRVRLYSPLLQAHATAGSIKRALDVWKRLVVDSPDINKQQQRLVPSEADYASLLRMAQSSHDAQIAERVLQDVADLFPIPMKELLTSIVDWYSTVQVQERNMNLQNRNADFSKLLDSIEVPFPEANSARPRLPVETSTTWTISTGDIIDQSTGVLQTGVLQGCNLQPDTLSQYAWDTLLTANEQIAVQGSVPQNASCPFQGGRKGQKRAVVNVERQQLEWERFNQFLAQQLQQQPIGVVLDGANIGYYGANTAAGNECLTSRERHALIARRALDFWHIDAVVRQLLEDEKNSSVRILVILHSRHFYKLPGAVKDILSQWNGHPRVLLYKTPAGMNDDWFVMHAALVSGPKTQVVTNDELRDHEFQVLDVANRYLARWKEGQRISFHVHYDSNARTSEEGKRAVKLTYPRVYSRRIQQLEDKKKGVIGLVIPLPKKDDDDGRYTCDEKAAGTELPIDETYLCICGGA